MTHEELQQEVVRLTRRVEALEKAASKDSGVKKLARRVAELELRAMQARGKKP